MTRGLPERRAKAHARSLVLSAIRHCALAGAEIDREWSTLFAGP